MTNEKSPQVEKKTYIKPQLTEVRLVAGEAVLGFCKDGTGGTTLCNSNGDPNCGPINETGRS